MVNRFPKLGTEIPIALFLLLVSIGLFLPVLIQSDVLVYNGDIDLFFPNEVVIQDSMTRGDSLLWNSYFGAGSPGLGRIQLGLFYPPMFLMRHLMPIVSRFNWDAVFNVFLAGYGMYWFVRDLVRRRTPAVFSALAFMLSGSIIPRIFAGHVSVLHSIIWAGWLLFAYRRMLLRKSWWYLMLTIVFSSLVLLGGQPQMSAIVLILPVSFFIFVYAADKIRHKSWSDLAEGTALSIAAGILSLTLIAVQLVPFLEWLPWTQRGAGEAFDSLDVMLRQSVQLPNLLTPFMPLAWASPERALTIQFSSISHFWETSLFVGILTLVLAVLSVILVDEKNKRLARFLIGTALVAAFLSIGPGNPIYTPLLENFPYIRAPGRFLILWTFALSVLAGLALDGLLSRWSLGSERGFPIKAAAGISAFSLAVVLVVVGWNVSGMTVPRFLINQFRYDYSLGFVQDLLQRSSIILALTVLVISALFWLPVLWPIKPRIWGFLALGVVLAELLVFSLPLIRPYPVIRLRDPHDPMAILDISPGEVRIDGYREPPSYLVPTLDHNKNGEESVALMNLLNDRENGKRLLSASYYAVGEMLNASDMELVQQKNSAYLYKDVDTVPRIYASDSVEAVRSDIEALLFVTADTFNYKEGAVVTISDTDLLEAFRDLGLNDVSDEPLDFFGEYVIYDNSSIKARVILNKPALVIFNEMRYPGWQASIDGESTEIYRANYAFRGIVVGEGEHSLEMRFEPLSYRTGIIISSLTILVLVIGSILVWMNNKKEDRSTGAG